MNTTGMIRGYMSQNMKAEEFIKVVVKALSCEFEKNVKLESINENNFKIALDNFQVTMGVELINKLKSPYGVDKYILEEFEKQGLKFDRNRSQYIQYCFGNFESAHIN
jgi:hypothetical protein